MFERVFSVYIPGLIYTLPVANDGVTDNNQVLIMKPFNKGLLSSDVNKYEAKESDLFSATTEKDVDDKIMVALTYEEGAELDSTQAIWQTNLPFVSGFTTYSYNFEVKTDLGFSDLSADQVELQALIRVRNLDYPYEIIAKEEKTIAI